MNIKISHYTIPIKFAKLKKKYGLFEPQDDGSCIIYIDERLSGSILVEVLFHEIGHLAYFLHSSKGEESEVSSMATIIVEALARNKAFRELILENL